MNPQICKQIISFLLVFAMLFTLPVTAHASELDNDSAEQTAQVANTTGLTEETGVPVATEAVIVQPAMQVHQASFDAILTKWLGTTQITEAALEAAVNAIDDYREALWEVYEAENAIVADIEDGILTEAQVTALINENPVFSSFAQLLQERYESDDSVQFYNEVSVLGGKITVTDNKNSISVSNDVVTVTASGGVLSQTTNSITIANASANTATISFDYSASNYKNFSESSATGKKTADLDAGGSITMSITGKAALWSNTATLKLSNFSYKAAAASSTVTFDYSGGTVTVNGEAVANGGTKDISSSDGATLVATPSSGYKFLGWVNGNNNVLISTEASYVLKPTANMTVRAAFASAGTKAWFKAGDCLVDDLNVAVTLSTKVLPVYDGTLPAGNYTIPAGVTLLIPYDAAGTLCTDKPTTNEVNIVNDGKMPSVFRMLTMANGANITVNGAISVSGSQSSCYGYNGMPYGPLGFIDMKSGSTITVNNGANLYVWGYITGSGSVEIKSGGTVHEHFQIADFRGGDVTTQMAGKDDEYNVFPFNQYYIQNVEVPMTLHKGAVEKGRGSVSITLAGIQAISIPFIGHTSGDSMFVIQSGYIVKDYMEGTGRTEVKIYGDLSVSEVNLSMKVSLIGSLDIESSKYVLPIPHHFTVSVESGSISMDQTMAFLPGSELYIREGATCTLGTGKKLYVYDLDQWLYNEGANGYSGTTNQPYMTVKYVPGGDGTTGRLKDALVQVDGTVDVSAGSAYVTSSGANIYSTGTGKVIVGSTKDTKTYQVTTGGSKGTDITGWPEIPVVPAILQDDDSTDVSTATAGAYTYYAATGKWCPPGHRYNDGEVIAPTCTAAGYTKYTCVACGDIKTTAGDAAVGHKYASVTTNPTASTKGYKTFNCASCGDSYTEDLYAAQVNGTNYLILNDAIAAANRSTPVTLLHNIEGDVPVGKLVSIDTAGFTAEINAEEGFALSQDGSVVTVLIKIYATNISAGDGLDMYFYIHKNAMPDTKGYTPYITRDYADEDPQTVAAEWEPYDEAPLWRFCYHDIAAKEMTDELTAVVTYDGVQVSNTHKETIKSYAIRTLGSKDKEDTEVDEGAALDTALMDMLNYGAGAQTIFNYSTGELANIVYDETTEGKLSTYAGSATQEDIITESNLVKGSDNNLKAVSVSAKNKLMLTFYFANITTDMTAEITYTNHNGAVKTDTVNGSEFVPYGNWLGVDVTGLAIADGRQVVTCTVKDGDKTIATASDSVEGYVHRNSGSNEVLKLLMKFVDSAYNYFHPTGDA